MESVGRLNCIAVDGDSHMRGGQCDNIHVFTTAAVPSPLGWRMDDNGGFGLDEVRVRKAWTPAVGITAVSSAPLQGFAVSLRETRVSASKVLLGTHSVDDH